MSDRSLSLKKDRTRGNTFLMGNFNTYVYILKSLSYICKSVKYSIESTNSSFCDRVCACVAIFTYRLSFEIQPSIGESLLPIVLTLVTTLENLYVGRRPKVKLIKLARIGMFCTDCLVNSICNFDIPCTMKICFSCAS